MASKCQRIMVQIGDRAWTQEALYQACILARKNQGEIALVKMVPVQHIAWLGTDLGNLNITAQDRADMKNYEATAEDFGVAASIYFFQYSTLVDAIAQAAECTQADIVFAKLAKSLIPYWTQFQTNRLRHHLMKQQCALFDIDHNRQPIADDADDVPSSPDLHAEFLTKSQQ